MTDEPIHAGILRVDLRVFDKLLQLPDHMRVRGIHVAEWSKALHLYVESPEFPEVREGCDLDRVGDVQVMVFAKRDKSGQMWFRTETSYVPRS